MIVFGYRSTYIRVMRLSGMEQPTDNLGKIFRTTKNRGPGIIGRTEWFWDGCYRAIDSDTLDDSEKRQIIGMLDNLNSIRYRPQADMQDQWHKITGLAPA